MVREIAKSKSMQTIHLWRKYPYNINMAKYASFMIGAKFQGSNKPDLSDSHTFHTIDSLPYGMKENPVSDQRKYRYLIYRFDGLRFSFPAEIEFYGIMDGREVKLSGTEIGNKGTLGSSIFFAWDSDRNTFYQNDISDERKFIGIDLGKDNECKVTRIRFCPRNDTNEVLPGLNYELFYWDNEWVSLGTQQGQENKPLVFDNAPQYALFWLHTDVGKEERIFTYENGKQVWW